MVLSVMPSKVVRLNPGPRDPFTRELAGAFNGLGLSPLAAAAVATAAELRAPMTISAMAAISQIPERDALTGAREATARGLLLADRDPQTNEARYQFDRETFWLSVVTFQLEGIQNVGRVFARNLPMAMPLPVIQARLDGLRKALDQGQ